MKYFQNIFVALTGVPFLMCQALLPMEAPSLNLPLGLKMLDIGTLSVKGSCKLSGRSVFKHRLESTFFGVYDGYGDVAPYLAQNLHSKENLLKSTTEHIKDCFNSADDWAKTHCYQGGATAVIALLTGKTLTIANCGNCRAIIFLLNDKKDTMIWSTLDHKPGDDGPHAKKGENERIRKAGGACYLVDTTSDLSEIKLDGIFSMSRAIGYHPKPNGLIADPDICIFTLDSSYKFMILVSHGISKVINNDQAVDLVIGVFRLHGNAKKAAQRLVDEAYKKGSREDELTAQVIRFIWKPARKNLKLTASQ